MEKEQPNIIIRLEYTDTQTFFRSVDSLKDLLTTTGKYDIVINIRKVSQ